MAIQRRVSRWRLALGVLGLCSILGAGTAAAFDTGFRDMKFHDDERERTIPVALWYPSEGAAAPLTYAGIHAGHAAPDSAIAPGRHPLTVLSHGTGGNRFNQFHIAEFLANNGYIVAAIEHPGDKTFDNGDFGTAKNLYNRPRDIGFTIDALSADTGVGGHIDGQRIAALGHSAGGFTPQWRGDISRPGAKLPALPVVRQSHRFRRSHR